MLLAPDAFVDLHSSAISPSCGPSQPDDSSSDLPSVVAMDVDTKASGVPAPGSDADVQEAAAILLAFRLDDRCSAGANAVPMPIQQQQEAMQGLALAEPSSTEASPEGLQSTSSTEDFLVIHPDRVSAEGAYPDLPQWARRAPRSGLARPSTDRAEGTGNQAAGAQPQDPPCHGQWYVPPPPGDKTKEPVEQLSGTGSGPGSRQDGSWTTRFQHADSASDGSSHGECHERGPTPAPRAQSRQPRGARGRGAMASIRAKAVLIFDFLQEHKQLADEPASQLERALLRGIAKLTPEQKERAHRLNPSCREKFIREDPRIKGSHTTSKALRMLVDDNIVPRSCADPRKPAGGKGNPYEYMIAADAALVLTTSNYEAVKELCKGQAGPSAEQPAANQQQHQQV